MKVTMKRVIRMAPYETMDYLIEVSSGDLPRKRKETLHDYEIRLHEFAYFRIIGYLMFHGQVDESQAKQEMKKFKDFYGRKTTK